KCGRERWRRQAPLRPLQNPKRPESRKLAGRDTRSVRCIASLVRCISKALPNSLFVVSLENLTYFEVVSLISFVGLNFHLVTKPAVIIETLLQNLGPDHLQDEVFFCDLDDWPGRLTGFFVSFFTIEFSRPNSIS